MIGAGKLRQTVTFQQRSGQPDEHGHKPWVNVITTRAQVVEKSAIQSQQDYQDVEITQYEITIRYKPDISPKMRIKYGEKYLTINAITNVRQLNRQMLIQAEETDLG